jgi:hypothetical protein
MPTPTYTPLATVTLGSSAASVTFSSIPATYRDLILVANFTGSAANEDADIAFNSDTAANYTRVAMFANTAGPGTFSNTSRSVSAIYSSNRTTTILNVMDYSATDKHKTILNRFSNAGQSEVVAYAHRWANTAAITSLSLIARTGTFSSASTFNLFGVIA